MSENGSATFKRYVKGALSLPFILSLVGAGKILPKSSPVRFRLTMCSIRIIRFAFPSDKQLNRRMRCVHALARRNRRNGVSVERCLDDAVDYVDAYLRRRELNDEFGQQFREDFGNTAVH